MPLAWFTSRRTSVLDMGGIKEAGHGQSLYAKSPSLGGRFTEQYFGEHIVLHQQNLLNEGYPSSRRALDT